MTEEHWMLKARRLIHEAVREASKLDPDLEGELIEPRGWILVVDLQGFAHPDDETLIESVRGQTLTAMKIWSSDATGDGDLPPHQVGGLLMYAGAHSDEYVYGDEGEDDND